MISLYSLEIAGSACIRALNATNVSVCAVVFLFMATTFRATGAS